MNTPDDNIINKYKDVPSWVFYQERQKIELSNDLGIMDKDELALLFAITEYAEKYGTTYLPIQNLYKYIYDYGLRVNNNTLKVEDNIINLIKSVYISLHKKKYCTVESKDNKLIALILLDPQILSPEQTRSVINKLKKIYSSSDQDYSVMFPGSDDIPKSGLSGKILNTVSIKEMNNQKIKELEQAGPITKVFMPSNEDIVVPTDELNRLYNRAFQKIKKYMYESNDFSSLISLKLKQAFPNNPNLNSSSGIMKVVETDPKFAVALSNEILNNTHNNDKERSINQAADILKNMSIMQSEQAQLKTHMEKSMEMMLKIMENYPVAFNRNQLLKLREKHTFLKLYTERDYIDVVNNFIQHYTFSDSVDIPPILIQLKLEGENKYIHREHFFYTFFEKVESIAFELKKEFVTSWEQANYNPDNDRILNDPAVFEKYIDNYFHNKDEYLAQMIDNSKLLYNLFVFVGNKDLNIKKQMDRFFFSPSSSDNPIKRPTYEILLFDRNKLLKEAYDHSPMSMKFSLIKFIFSLFRGFGKRMEKAIETQMVEKKNMPKFSELLQQNKSAPDDQQGKKTSVQEPAKTSIVDEKNEAIKKSLQNFRDEFTGGKKTDEMLQFFEQHWNHVINNNAREENLKIIKEKIHHRLKFMKNAAPPLIIKETNDMMKTESIFNNIADHDSLKSYIILYMTEYFIQKNIKAEKK